MAASQWAPWVRLATPSVLLPYTVIEWVTHAGEGTHPWAQLTVRYQLSPGFRVAADHLPPSLWWEQDTPVQVTWGSTAAIRSSFVGYVVSPELLSHPDTQQQEVVAGQMIDIRYTLLGASKVLQTARTRTWRHCTAAYMAQNIADLSSLAAVTDVHARVYDQRVQPALSDFRFLQERAAETGFRLTVDGTTLEFTDPRRQLVASVPQFLHSRTPGMADTMQVFQAVAGETDPAGAIRAAHTAVAVSAGGVLTSSTAWAPRPGLVSGVDVVPQTGRHTTDYVAQDYTSAAQLTAAAALGNLWWVHANATTDGDPRLRPGCVVAVGGSALTGQYTGLWMTRSARHRLVVSPLDSRLSTYYTDLELGRDQAASLTHVPYTAAPAYTSTTVGGRWQAQRQGSW